MYVRFIPYGQSWGSRPKEYDLENVVCFDRNIPELYQNRCLFSYAKTDNKETRPQSTKYCLGKAGTDPKDPGFLVFGDSGGFTVAREGASYDPIQVLLWQIDWATRGPILDIPPYEYGEGGRVTKPASEKFEKSLSRTVEGMRRALPYYEGLRNETQFRWWGALHGQTEEQLTRWYEEISNVYPFSDRGEGWAIAARGPRRTALTRFLKFSLDHSLKRIHFLALSGWRDVGTLLGLLHRDKRAGELEELNFDAATASITGVKLLAFVDRPEPYAWGDVHIKDWAWDCECYACRHFFDVSPHLSREKILADYSILTRSDRSALGPHLAIHNVLKTCEKLEVLFAEAELYPRSILKSCAGKDLTDVNRIWYGDVSASALRIDQSRKPTAEEIFGV